MDKLISPNVDSNMADFGIEPKENQVARLNLMKRDLPRRVQLRSRHSRHFQTGTAMSKKNQAAAVEALHRRRTTPAVGFPELGPRFLHHTIAKWISSQLEWPSPCQIESAGRQRAWSPIPPEGPVTGASRQKNHQDDSTPTSSPASKQTQDGVQFQSLLNFTCSISNCPPTAY
jgi:hypothetical protein